MNMRSFIALLLVIEVMIFLTPLSVYSLVFPANGDAWLAAFLYLYWCFVLGGVLLFLVALIRVLFGEPGLKDNRFMIFSSLAFILIPNLRLFYILSSLH